MFKKKDILVTSFAMFSLFFGAGNLILPPFLGLKAGGNWLLVTLGFCISAMLIPLLGILAHAKLQGTLMDFGKKVSPTFALVYSCSIYAIAIALPGPRTASVTHEMAIAPFIHISPWVSSSFYFGLVLIFALNRSRILSVLGKMLTPAIILMLLFIIGNTVLSFPFNFSSASQTLSFTTGILEGYQTFDAIGAVVVGGVIIVSINQRHKEASYQDKKTLIRKAGWIAGLALFLIYLGLILSGALVHEVFDENTSRTTLLSGLAKQSLGGTGNLFLSVLVAIACFTTAVGIVTGTADFVQSQLKNSKVAYITTAILGSVFGVLMGQFDVTYIIAIALPALLLMYPITIVLIFLNSVPNRYASSLVFKAVTITTLLSALPDFLQSVHILGSEEKLCSWIPLQSNSLGWVLPSIVVFLFVNLYERKKQKILH